MKTGFIPVLLFMVDVVLCGPSPPATTATTATTVVVPADKNNASISGGSVPAPLTDNVGDANLTVRMDATDDVDANLMAMMNVTDDVDANLMAAPLPDNIGDANLTATTTATDDVDENLMVAPLPDNVGDANLTATTNATDDVDANLTATTNATGKPGNETLIKPTEISNVTSTNASEPRRVFFTFSQNPVEAFERVTLSCKVPASHTYVLIYKNDRVFDGGKKRRRRWQRGSRRRRSSRVRSERQARSPGGKANTTPAVTIAYVATVKGFVNDSDGIDPTMTTQPAPTSKTTINSTAIISTDAPVITITKNLTVMKNDHGSVWYCAATREDGALDDSSSVRLEVTWPPTCESFSHRISDRGIEFVVIISANPPKKNFEVLPFVKSNKDAEETIFFGKQSHWWGTEMKTTFFTDKKHLPLNLTVNLRGMKEKYYVIPGPEARFPAGVVVGLLFLILLIAAGVFVWWKYKRDGEIKLGGGKITVTFSTKRPTGNGQRQPRTSLPLPRITSFAMPDAIEVKNFFDEYWASQSNFKAEFQSLSKSKDTCEVGKQDENLDDNRYVDILPYDSSRVILKPDNEIEDLRTSDYINANFVDGFRRKNAFIASQGPLVQTLDDHWQMIWQEKVNCVLMLANLVEDKKQKVALYWPEEKAETRLFDKITVKLDSEEKFADFNIRHFTVEKNGQNGIERRNLTQYQFVSWPDHGVPRLAIGMAYFVTLVRRSHANEPNPILVHCSAGVGRTGTFIALWKLIDEAKANNEVHVFKCVEDMRKKRMKLVQTPAQYKFIYEAFAMLSKAELKDIELADADAMSKCNMSGRSLLATIDKWKAQTSRKSTMGQRHKSKMRYRQGPFPPDHSLVPLEGPLFDHNECFINAAFVDGYTKKRKYIATQAPLTNTIGDFWKLVWEYEATMIIMLNAEDATAPDYWNLSAEAHEPLKPLKVEFLEESQEGVLKVISVKIKNLDSSKEPSADDQPNSEDVRTVQLIQVLNWPEDADVPSDVSSIFDSSSKVLDNDHPVVVHCLNGTKKTGLYLACLNLLAKARKHSLVHVACAALSVRDANPNFMQSAAQMEFLIRVAQQEISRNGGGEIVRRSKVSESSESSESSDWSSDDDARHNNKKGVKPKKNDDAELSTDSEDTDI